VHNSQAGSLGATRPFAPVSSNFQNTLAMPANSTSQHQSPHKPTSSQPHARQGGRASCSCPSHSDGSFSRPLNFETSRCTTPPTNQAMQVSFRGGPSLALVYERQVPSFRSISSPSTSYPSTTEKEKSGHTTAPTAIVSTTTPLAQIAAAQTQQRVTSPQHQERGAASYGQQEEDA
jgi:hypothetical protein